MASFPLHAETDDRRAGPGRAGRPGAATVKVRAEPAPTVGTGVELTQRLLAYLAAGGISPGQRLPGERALAEQLSVGRNVLREALKSLTLLGFLEVRQGDGTYVATTTSSLLPRIVEWALFLADDAIEELIDARARLEVVLAGMAAERGDKADLARVQQFFDFMEHAAEAGETDRYAAADTEFHLAIAAASGNSVLAGVVTNIRSLLRGWADQVLASHVELHDSLRLHSPILAALHAGDGDAARAAMSEHMDQAVANLRRATNNAREATR